MNYKAVAITDHVGIGYLERLITEIARDCALARAHWDIDAIPGVELTHVPADAIDKTAETAKALGAKLVVVHGQTTAELVEPAASNVYLEITSRRMHSATNEHVTRIARLAGASLVINSDSHDGDDLLTPELARSVAQSAGMNDEEIENALLTNPLALLNRLSSR